MSGTRTKAPANLHGSADPISPRIKRDQRVSLMDATDEYMANGPQMGEPTRTLPEFLRDDPTPAAPAYTDPDPQRATPAAHTNDGTTPQRATPATTSTDPDPAASADVDMNARVVVAGNAVSLSELRDGYLRMQDYTRKTQDLARMREDVAKQRDTAIPTMQIILDKVLGVPPAPDVTLYQQNATEYMRQATARDQIVAVRRDVETMLADTLKAHGEHAEQAKKDKVANATRELLAMYPQWLDQATGKTTELCTREMGEVVACLTKHGFTNEEIQSIDDARYIPIIRKAAGFDALRASGASAKRVPSSGPSPVVRAGGGISAQQPRQQPTNGHLFEQTGKLTDAVAEYADQMETAQRDVNGGGNGSPLAARGRRRLN